MGWQLIEMELAIQLLLVTIGIFTWSSRAAESPSPNSVLVGFKATPNPDISSFQPLLNDSSGNYSLGFLRVNRNQLSLSVLHVPSSAPLWSARTTRLPRWANPTQLFFNGSLVLSDPHTGVYWSTATSGDRVWLSNTSNLIIQKLNGSTVLWQSFDFPSDTLVENQNFSSTMALVSSNGLYSMRLGPDYMGLHANFSNSDQIYLKHRALEAKADIVPGQPIYMVLKSDGYLGMFQNGSVPVDVQSFNTFQQNVSGIRRVRIEPDGNLKGYYWTGSGWILDYQAISEPCELPSFCGPYGLCNAGKDCSCLDNRTLHGCAPPRDQISGDFCGAYDNRFRVLKRTGVELPFKELMGYRRTTSYEECEGSCEGNCTCWGVAYSNSSGFCYMLDYPIETLVAVRDESKMGYFKMRQGVGKKKVGAWVGLGLGLLFGAVLTSVGVLGLWWYKLKSRGVRGYGGEDDGGLGVGPYKDLGAASFRSIELCER
ncbi:D-mannose binding lectin protein with Apple-like carbohydrate-binding domain-containing protein [Perilla frutescens var. frutescens]|nr:D-mannose binding lectin protein with Apple-like carbohydrate-binding domain-containing protein [Perilla frutescens var. frutescens]